MAVSKKRVKKKKVEHCNYTVRKENKDGITEGNGSSREHKMSIYFGIASLIGAYIFPMLGFITGILGWQNANKAVKLHNESKIPLIINIIGTIVSGLLLIVIFSMPR